MAATTLAIGATGYELLDLLDSSSKDPVTGPLTSESGPFVASSTDTRRTVLKSGNNRTLNLRSSDPQNGTISDLGIGADGATALDNNTTNIFANVSEFTSIQGALNDTLNIFGNAEGVNIFSDEGITGINSLVNESDSTAGDDLVRISGNLSGSEYNSTRSTIYTDDGDDTIRIGGNVSDTDFFLGNQSDLLDIRGNISNSYISTDGSGSVDLSGNPTDDGASGNGNDYVRIGGTATSTIIQTYGGNDTVNFGGSFNGTYIKDTGTDRADAAVELGAGQDSLVLSNGANTAQFNTGAGSDTVNLSGEYNETSFYLGGDSLSATGDYFSSGRNGSFINSTISSGNTSGDTLIFGSGSSFLRSSITNSDGADSMVFGSGLAFNYSSISTNGGGDTLVFGANSSFFNSTLDLGSNSTADQIYFSGANSDLSGLSISGADSNDRLFIGTTEYLWNDSDSTFVDKAGSAWSAYSA